MKNVLFITFLFFTSAGNSFAQTDANVKFTEEKSKFFGACDQALIITLGYVPNSKYNAVKGNIAWNNFLFNRFGAYTSFEKGLDSGYFSNLYGVTFSLHEKVYLFGGADLFTKNGVFSDSEIKTRKEIGIGIIPYKRLAVNMGWSSGVGITFGVGLKIPL